MNTQVGIVSSTKTKTRPINIAQVGKWITLWELSEHIRLTQALEAQKVGS